MVDAGADIMNNFYGKPGALKLIFTLDSAASGNISITVDNGAPHHLFAPEGSATYNTDPLDADQHTIYYVVTPLGAAGGNSDLSVEVQQNGSALDADPSNDPDGNPFTRTGLSMNVGTPGGFGVALA